MIDIFFFKFLHRVWAKIVIIIKSFKKQNEFDKIYCRPQSKNVLTKTLKTHEQYFFSDIFRKHKNTHLTESINSTVRL